MMKTFEMNGTAYQTDEETLDLLREQVKANRLDAIAVIMSLGLKTGRILEVK